MNTSPGLAWMPGRLPLPLNPSEEPETPILTPGETARARTLYFLTHREQWPLWPFLPVVRRPPGREEELGVVFDALGAVRLAGFSATVFKTNLFLLPSSLDDFLLLPRRWTVMPDAFAQALLDATNTTARENVRFALSRVQLQGGRGQVVATDGRQLLVRGGFTLPWKEDLLVPRLPALGLRELRGEGPVAVCRTGEHVSLRLGPWTFFLSIDRTSRFPDVQTVIPRPSAFTSRLRLDAEDAVFLAKALPALPGGDEDNAPVTLDLGRRAVVRARSGGDAVPAELELARSVVEGRPARLCLNRLFLRRALALGFRELHVGAPGSPAAWRDGRDLYLFVPLDAGAALPSGEGSVRVPSPTSVSSPDSDPHPDPQPDRKEHPMPEPRGNGHAAEDSPEQTAGIEALIAEAEELRRALQDAAVRTGRLAAALRQQRRQSRAVQAAVAALRGLRIGR